MQCLTQPAPPKGSTVYRVDRTLPFSGAGQISRRALLAAAAGVSIPAVSGHARATPIQTIEFALSTATSSQVDPSVFSVCGIYDFDLLLTPEFDAMLDLIAGSPGSISGIRAFGLFTMGSVEALMPESGGVVWTDSAAPPDFTLPLAALDALVRRGLKPFIALGFFPPAISTTPIEPPADFTRWTELVGRFLETLLADERFGAEEISTWHFEVWNEPNEGRFWSGSFDDYLELYRATAEAVTRSDARIRIGGPAMAYKPESSPDDGPATMRRFLEFLRDHPELPCDFISYHRKGTVDSTSPDPHRLWQAALEIAELIGEIAPERLSALTLINNEADEKIGFETPYLPRMGPFAASWLTTLATTHSALAAQTGIRFSALQDNLNLQLMETPFDGRRSIFSFLDPSERSNLVKTSGAVWYDLLPFLHGRYVPATGATPLFPASDIHALCVAGDTGTAMLITWHPLGSDRTDQQLTVSVSGLNWPDLNISEWRIDDTHSNGYGEAETPSGDLDQFADRIRAKQELTLVASRREHAPDGNLKLNLVLSPFATVLCWITPHETAPIVPPTEAFLRITSFGVELRWRPAQTGSLLGYEIARNGAIVAGPIRPCFWIDSHDDRSTYQLRSVGASGQASDWVEVQRED